MNNFIERCPAWYTEVSIKPLYENEKSTITWNIPEYTGYEEIKSREGEHVKRPDAKIILRDQKVIYVLEMTVPWIENRAVKLTEKIEKYLHIIQGLKVEFPNYKVEQLTFIMDCLGGFSSNLKENVKKLGFDDKKCKTILNGMQKIILSEASTLIDRFKVMTHP